MVLNLAASRFYDYAAMIATDPLINKDEKISDEDAIKDILIYHDFICRVRDKTEKFYIATATSGGKNGFFPKIFSWFRDNKFDRTLNDE